MKQTAKHPDIILAQVTSRWRRHSVWNMSYFTNTPLGATIL